jgi:hypothetical protein
MLIDTRLDWSEVIDFNKPRLMDSLYSPNRGIIHSAARFVISLRFPELHPVGVFS